MKRYNKWRFLATKEENNQERIENKIALVIGIVLIIIGILMHILN